MTVPFVSKAASALIIISSIFSANAASLPQEASPASHYLQKRALAVPSTLPGNWTYKGCYVDAVNGRVLTGAATASGDSMTAQYCINYCSNKKFSFAGTEYGTECYCGSRLNSDLKPDSDCNMECSGAKGQACGGPSRMTVYNSGEKPPAGPFENPGPGKWTSFGCYTDSFNRILSQGMDVPGGGANLTVANCAAACQNGNYKYAGVEYSGECFCGQEILNNGAPATEGCTMTCNGNSTEYCGGSFRMNLYAFNTTRPLKMGWNDLGCYTDNVGGRTLTHGTNVPGGNTVEGCQTACKNGGYTYAGVEYSGECYCDNALMNGGGPAPDGTDGCNMPCNGNSQETCGGANRLNMYQYYTGGNGATSTSATSAGPTATPSTPAGWTNAGCYTDNVGARTLGNRVFPGGAMTVELCTQACKDGGYSIAGVEYSGECYCDSQFRNGGKPATDGCTMPCDGNKAETCGGADRLNVYTVGSPSSSSSAPASTAASSAVSSAASSGASSAASSGPTSAPSTVLQSGASSVMDAPTSILSSGALESTAAPSTTVATFTTLSSIVASTLVSSAIPTQTNGFPAGWDYAGCYVDNNSNGRNLGGGETDDPQMTQELCISVCIKAGFTVAAIEYSTQCFCDNYLRNSAPLAANDNECGMNCGGNANEKCGGPNRLSVFSKGPVTVKQAPKVQTTNLPGSWQYTGCLKDNTGTPQTRTFPWQTINTKTNNATTCLQACSDFGYEAGGMEYGEECYCGDAGAIPAAATLVDDAQCNTPCPGNPEFLCGSGNLISYYQWKGTPLNSFSYPTGAGAGQYKFLIGGVVIPLMTSVNVNGKVTFLEKFGTGAANTTGAYEFDPAFDTNFDKAWRPLVGLKTDIFCAAGVILPDKAGRQLTVGGWSGISTEGIRLYIPDGKAGQTSSNNWQEDPDNLHLQAGRWYPSVMVMASGKILVVGGERGSNDVAVPSLEVLPSSSPPQYMDWLARTDPNNLYPFLAVLPGGGIFVAYWNEARILDENSFATTKTLPKIPGAVNNILGGRTYPLEGTMMLLPQYANNYNDLGVLICGGSTPNEGNALDNCVTIHPDAANPKWELERMPSKRVISSMVALPDGTYLILNGGQKGVAGFGLAKVPNLNAVLYDPSKTLGSRFSVMANTTIARMYHSEAVLMPDGRVLVSGSDPQDADFPQEYRVEVFIPPYLLSGLARPSFDITNKDWSYGQSVTFTVTGNTGNLRVSLLGAETTTHGNSMGARTIFPAVSCAGNTCTVTAPPNAHVCPPGWFKMFVLDGPTPSIATFVRIGGDPAGLGNWPNIDGFTKPGV